MKPASPTRASGCHHGMVSTESDHGRHGGHHHRHRGHSPGAVGGLKKRGGSPGGRGRHHGGSPHGRHHGHGMFKRGHCGMNDHPKRRSKSPEVPSLPEQEGEIDLSLQLEQTRLSSQGRGRGGRGGRGGCWMGRRHGGQGRGGRGPRVDLAVSPQAYQVVVDLPGVPSQDVKVSFERCPDTQLPVLVLEGEKKGLEMKAKDGEEKEGEGDGEGESMEVLVQERRVGPFSRRLRLPADANVEAFTSTHTDGVLHVTIPRTGKDGQQVSTMEVA